MNIQRVFYLMSTPKALAVRLLEHSASMWSDKTYLKLMYFLRTGSKLNLANPLKFTEKLQWLKLYDHNPYYTKLVDKYEAKRIVTEKVGLEYVIPLYGAWDSFEEINFGSLPNTFVLKTNHDSDGMVVCKDKASFDMDFARKKLTKHLKNDYWLFGREWPYKDIPRKIIAEKYEPSLMSPAVIEYKLTCVMGGVKMITVCTGLAHTKERRNDHFDLNWNRLLFDACHPNTNREWALTPEIKKMIEISEILSQGMTTSRIDFYLIDGQIKVGEISIYTNSGMMKYQPLEWDYKMGEWLQLPNKRQYNT